MKNTNVNRRFAIAQVAGAAVALAWHGPALAAAAGSSPLAGTITVLYRRSADRDAPRTDTAAEAAVAALEEHLGDAGLRVLKPDAQAMALLEHGPGVILNFDADAGFALEVSVTRSDRALTNGEMRAAEVEIRGKVFYGPSVVVSGASAQGRGAQLFALKLAEARDAAMTNAAQAAARQAAQRIVAQLRKLTPERLTALARPVPGVVQGGQIVAQPRPATPAVAPPLKPPAQRHALVVGVSDYSVVNRNLAGQFSMGNLPGVAEDMRILPDALRALGFDKDRVTVLQDRQATSANVRAELMRLAGRVQPDDLVVVAFSAHGAPAQYSMSGYGLPVLDDYRGPDDGNAIDFWQVQGLLANLPAAQVVLVVDTCHAGGAAMRMPRLRVGAADPRVESGTVTPDAGRVAADAGYAGKHYAILTAATPEQLSLEDPPHGGLFTSRLVAALRSNKGQRPLAELFERDVRGAVTERATQVCANHKDCVPQTPMFAYTGQGDRIVI